MDLYQITLAKSLVSYIPNPLSLYIQPTQAVKNKPN